jgi:hypothetical protein
LYNSVLEIKTKMSKSKLWRFKTFLIVATLVLLAVAAAPASVVYFSDSFKKVEKAEVETQFNAPDLISNTLQKMASLARAKILEKF